jgi:hypothetical protein
LDGSWLPPVAIAATGSLRASPRLAVDRAGNVVLAWITSREDTGPRLEASYRLVHSNWTPRRRLSPDGIRPRTFALTAASHRRAAVAWMTNVAVVQARRFSVQ